MTSVKIVLLGPSAVGKTTIRKIFFENEDPELLLQNPLEPTYGIDVNNYSIGEEIGVHDLAGQQMEDWLEHEFSIFFQTDLLILMLDSTTLWDDNEQLWLRFYRKLVNHNFKFQWIILFNKCDLLSIQDRKALELKIKAYPFDKIHAVPYIISIKKEFFISTLEIMIRIIKRALFCKKTLYFDDLMKLNLLERAVKKFTIPFSDLDYSIIDQDTYINNYLSDLEKLGLLSIDSIIKQIRITNKGRDWVAKYSNRHFFKLLENQAKENQVLKGFCLSDQFGRQFFSFEEKENFFKNTFTNMGTDVDPSLITGFFYATKSFGDLMDEKGLNSIELKGQNIQIVIIMEKEIFGIFFLDNSINHGVELQKILELFLMRTVNLLKIEIEKFLITGDLCFISKKQTEIQDLINKLKQDLIELRLIKEKSEKLYTDVTFNPKISPIEKKQIRNDLFKSNLTDDNKTYLSYKKRFL